MNCPRCEELKNDDYREDKRCMRCRMGKGVFQVYPDVTARYEFVDYNVTGKPVQIHGKRHWRTFLKEHGMTDNYSVTKDTLKNTHHDRLNDQISRKLDEVLPRAIYEAKQKTRRIQYA